MLGLVVLGILAVPVGHPSQAVEDDVPSPIPESAVPNTQEEPSNQAVPFFGVDSDSGDGSVGVSVVLPPGASTSTEVGDNGSGGSGCSWRPVMQGDFPDSPGAAEGTQIVETGPDGVAVRRAFWRTCGGRAREFVWVAAQVDIGQLIDGAEARVRAATPVPVPDINPSVDVGSFVNLGLWLAVEDPGPTVARVGLAGEWARVEASHTGFETDLGNGDVVSCVGLGVPIVDLDTLEEGPCGYTYRLSSPDDDPYQVTITSFYEVSYQTSTGRSGSLEGLSRSVSFTYDIDEIQTVGTRN